MYYILVYDLADHFIDHRAPYREVHLKLVHEAHDRGELLLAGALSDPVDRALLVFRALVKSVVEQFARADSYVANGVVTRWEVRPWTVVVGGAERSPVSGRRKQPDRKPRSMRSI